MISGALATQPELLDDGVIDTEVNTNLAAALHGARLAPGSPSTGNAAIDPFAFYRQIVNREVDYVFTFADSDSVNQPRTATVLVRRHFTGTFNVVPRNPADPSHGDLNNVVHKYMHDHWNRRFHFRRVDTATSAHPIWKLYAVTAIDVRSEVATTTITSVRLQSTGIDTTLTNTIVSIRLGRVLRFTPTDPVTVTVTTPRTDDVVFLYHHDGRVRLTANGDGTYTGQFQPGTFTGWRHFAVDAMSRGTLYDDAAPYDSRVWIYPYVLASAPVVDLLP